MERLWDVDPNAGFRRRLGKTAAELEVSRVDNDCPEIWELDNGDIAVVGRDATKRFADRLPPGMSVGPDERLVVIPGVMLRAAKPDIPDA
ncbi:hypothetical protein ACFPZ0_12430 [Streptomonospora nanhaiensis]|uniref:hypothetical protein n=1 Tax=Streptomonospora nanhaiensis TaxID=1323731 RepID=UPI001C39392B|nr:hypothetical protein [Streptomonospora nanhaiensis]MBV2363432.1 hypothetical protein [Streptomonospora nanhaiensis]MBX9387666.1 hypothetical protein [Streptomonospora nanhaiensis]